jgi:2-iminobutanoate/2-iminopropanoate deaminase
LRLLAIGLTVGLGVLPTMTLNSPLATDLSRPLVAAEGLLYTSGLTSPATPGVDAMSAAEVDRQTGAVLDQLRTLLTANGSSLADVLSVNVFLKRATDFDAMNAVYKTYFADSPPARTTVAVDLPVGMLIQISAVAAQAGNSRLILLPSTWVKSPRPYSYIVRSGDMVFLSGLVSRRGTDDAVVPGSITVQTRQILENASTLLRTAGLTYDNVVAARVFLTDDSYFEEMNNEYRRYFSTEPPARATAIAGLMGKDSIVEITLVASSLPKEVIGPLVSPTLPVSTGIRAGSRVFLSGVLASTDTASTDAAVQTHETLGHLSHALELAHLTPADVVDTTVYIPHSPDIAAIDDVYRAFFPVAPPARTTAGARLVARTGLVEIMASAIQKH